MSAYIDLDDGEMATPVTPARAAHILERAAQILEAFGSVAGKHRCVETGEYCINGALAEACDDEVIWDDPLDSDAQNVSALIDADDNYWKVTTPDVFRDHPRYGPIHHELMDQVEAYDNGRRLFTSLWIFNDQFSYGHFLNGEGHQARIDILRAAAASCRTKETWD